MCRGMLVREQIFGDVARNAGKNQCLLISTPEELEQVFQIAEAECFSVLHTKLGGNIFTHSHLGTYFVLKSVRLSIYCQNRTS